MEKQWLTKIKKALLDRKITEIRYLTQAEANDLGWGARAVVLVLDNGTQIYPSQDDEGNNAGALFTTDESLPTIPVM